MTIAQSSSETLQRTKGPEPDDRHFVTALARGLEVLASFKGGDSALGNQEIARHCGLPKSTVSRLTATLARLGYLRLDEDTGKYHLGVATLALGAGMLAKLDVRQIAKPGMQKLASAFDGLVALGARDRFSMLYLEACRSPAALTLNLHIGSHVPIAVTAIGRAYLAEAGPAEQREVIERARELDVGTADAIGRGIAQALEDYDTLGCACCFGDWNPDVHSIAVGLRLGGNQPLMALNFGGPAFRMSREYLLNEVRPRLLDLASEIKEQTGSPG
ncbi:transcriptional regulator [Bordetella trematum]|uniref:IclR family transcriptional regulator n=1 Tax=Bordetella trematum TaxID=123899 RepID=UPI000794C77D|nr:IclR family transcriptional regulator [Bordetella trematum]QIM72606.1 IclR family transcriptional regulator [Bordetella trematum]SAI07583.1 transcriptional regulator [Bordetella trematum]